MPGSKVLTSVHCAGLAGLIGEVTVAHWCTAHCTGRRPVRPFATAGGGNWLLSFSAAPRSTGRHRSNSSRRDTRDAWVLTFIAATTAPTTFRTGTGDRAQPDLELLVVEREAFLPHTLQDLFQPLA